MDASKKQREPVTFKSLAELKRFIRPGVEIKTVSHANHADMVGLTRVVTTVQTVGFYSKIKDQPEHPFSTCNHGKGFYALLTDRMPDWKERKIRLNGGGR